MSLTSIVSKLLEGIIEQALMNHLVENNLITDAQHEFRENRSCLTNMLCYLDDIINNVDKSNFVHVKCLDCEKAFDKVPHRRLNMKVEAM